MKKAWRTMRPATIFHPLRSFSVRKPRPALAVPRSVRVRAMRLAKAKTSESCWA